MSVTWCLFLWTRGESVDFIGLFVFISVERVETFKGVPTLPKVSILYILLKNGYFSLKLGFLIFLIIRVCVHSYQYFLTCLRVFIFSPLLSISYVKELKKVC